MFLFQKKKEKNKIKFLQKHACLVDTQHVVSSAIFLESCTFTKQPFHHQNWCIESENKQEICLSKNRYFSQLIYFEHNTSRGGYFLFFILLLKLFTQIIKGQLETRRRSKKERTHFSISQKQIQRKLCFSNLIVGALRYFSSPIIPYLMITNNHRA